jgi:hypothetical protein
VRESDVTQIPEALNRYVEPRFLVVNAQIVRRLDRLSAAVTVIELKLASEVEQEQLS